MKVLVVGSGGREHALVHCLAESPRVEALLAAPGSDAIAERATCHPEVAATDVDALVALARREAADLVVVGPEDPLAAGLCDRLRDAGIPAFGPSAAAARLEASKAFAKEFMARHGIPTASFEVFDDLERARAYVRSLGGPCVVKADGLAAGKGVAVCDGPAQAEAALEEIMGARRFGAAGDRVVIEERLTGTEASYYAICDGERFVPLAAAQDHKRALDGDRGENTGGMGAFSPTPRVDPATEKRILEEIVAPAVAGMAAEGAPFTGVLFAGLMIDARGAPRVVEFNVRFGDPETQAIAVRLASDLLPLLEASARGDLGELGQPELAGAAVCVVLASAGYPRAHATGVPISGLAEAESASGTVVFHAGTRKGADGVYRTAGGRVLGVTARGATLGEARDRAYRAVGSIRFEGMHFRRDIGAELDR